MPAEQQTEEQIRQRTMAMLLLEEPDVDFPKKHLLGLDDVTPVPFHIGQEYVWDSSARFTIMSAGTQSGKTSFGPWWLAREIYGCDLEDEESPDHYIGQGAGDYFAVTATYDLFKLKMLPALQRVFVDILQMGRYWSGDRIIELKNPETGLFHAKRATDPMWGRIILRSADSEGGLESGTGKAAWLDEAGQPRFGIGAWRAIRRRLSLLMGRVLITSTLYDLGWIKELFLDLVQDGIEPLSDIEHTLIDMPNGGQCGVYTTPNSVDYAASIRVVQFDSIINPVFDPAEFIAARATMPDDEFDMFYRGRAAKLRGQIFDCFSIKKHVTEPIAIPKHWPVALGFDPIGQITAALYVAWDPVEYVLHAFDEYYEPFGASTAEHVRGVLVQMYPYKNQVIGIWGGGPSERQSRVDWNASGLPVAAPPLSDVWVGIRRSYSLLKGMALIVHDNCQYLIAELNSYRRERDKSGDVIPDQIHNKNDYHMIDCLRYVVVGLSSPKERVQIIPNRMLIGGY